MMNLRGILWRLVYAVLLVVILTVVIPLLLQLLGLPVPMGPAITLLQFAFAALILLYVFFGPEPPTFF